MKLATSGKAILTKGDKVYEFIFDDSKIALYKYTPVMPANDVDKINDEDKNLQFNFNAIGTSSLQILDIKGVVQGYNTIYSAEQSITMANESFNKKNGHYQTALFKDASNQISSLTRVYYNNLDAKGEMIGYR